ncbi:hypothetical protein T265_00689 [Opisthorchis viverrini]|uniref:Uncharacterized protein n=1 Tax=Opisthorchis viverrini TaxID=6198 RepID=A0A075A4Z4_OPIVI|nr:hypothetical protein T265_00689 [Opisthorchis viverrini]KER33367.1 hypothetical protein T265_00689 [Opisthorchis viverrini]
MRLIRRIFCSGAVRIRSTERLDPTCRCTYTVLCRIPYGAYVRPLLEYANQVVYSGRTKDVTLIERSLNVH